MQLHPIAHIDLAALQHNLACVKQVAPDSRIMSVVKANAYGHGLVDVARALSASDAFTVARLSEGLLLREAGIEHAIVVLEGVNTVSDLQLAAENDISLVFTTLLQIELVLSTTLSKALLFCWVMAETGMHRLGIPAEKLDQAIQSLKRAENIADSIGLMSHFANADLLRDERNQHQLDQIMQCAKQHRLSVSMANSAAILSFPESHADWIRPGIMLYGSSPFKMQSASSLNLKPVMKLTSTLIAIQNLKTGDEVGYGGDWVAEHDTRVGIVNIGYGDGYSRQLSNTGSVKIHNKIAAVLGRVSMDMIAIDLSHILHAKEGDDVVLWGCEQLPIEDVANKANTISYELLCQISERVRREYHG
ncbi:MAG: alanine racemase [Methylophaga sp.]|nr:MAG: alanine racemase [Methylophaga sp.]